jgi:tryptophan-rich sensory protein
MSPRGIGLRLGVAAGVIGAGFLAARPSQGGYRGFRQARFAPPPWVFGPAWTAIEVAGADSLVRVIEADEDSPHRRRALAAAAANDTLYVAFPVVYFRLRSPVLGAAVTWSQLVAVVVQARESRRADPVADRGLYPQLAWLLYAGVLGTVQALANPDPLLGTRALRPTLGRPRD